MRPPALVLVPLALLTLGTSFSLAAHAGVSGWPLTTFLDASPIPKLVMIMILIFGLPAVLVVGLVHQRGNRTQGTSGVLRLLSWLLIALGLLGTLYEGLNIWLAVQATHPTHFNVVAPSLSEALLPLGLSLLTAIVAAFLNRPARSAAPA